MYESAAVERKALERALPLVEGVVLGTSRMSDSAIRVMAQQRPTVVLNRVLTGIPSVITDNARGTRRAMEHLAELEHRSIGYVAGPEASWADGMRWRAMREAAEALDVRVQRFGPVAPTLGGGTEAAAVVAESAVTAVVAYNDLVAIGLMRGLAAAGVRVPRDVSVVGFDNIFGAELCSPALTTVAAPLAALGRYAVQTLLDRDVVAHAAAGPAGAPARRAGGPGVHGAAGAPTAVLSRVAGQVMATDCHRRCRRR